MGIFKNKNFNQTPKQGAIDLLEILITEGKKLIRIYELNQSKLDDVDIDTYEHSIKDEFNNFFKKYRTEDNSFEDFKEIYARFRNLYSLLESILVSLELEEYNKKEWENLENPEMPAFDIIMAIDESLGFKYKDEFDDPIQEYLEKLDHGDDTEHYTI